MKRFRSTWALKNFLRKTFDVCLPKSDDHFGHIVLRRELQQPKFRRDYYYTKEPLHLQNSLLPAFRVAGKVFSAVPNTFKIKGSFKQEASLFVMVMLTSRWPLSTPTVSCKLNKLVSLIIIKPLCSFSTTEIKILFKPFAGVVYIQGGIQEISKGLKKSPNQIVSLVILLMTKVLVLDCS